MKIRADFVTNSSSSSFVIAYKPIPDIDEDTLNKYPFLKNYGELIEKILLVETNETSKGEIIKTIEEYDKYFIDDYGWKENNTVEKILKDDPYLKDTYYQAKEYLQKGFVIVRKDVDYHDEYFSNMIRELSDDFIILED